MSKKSQHVVPADGKWAVRGGGSAKATRTFNTQHAAIKNAQRIARNQQAELVIHGRDGKIREKRSYGRDPFPPRDRR